MCANGRTLKNAYSVSSPWNETNFHALKRGSTFFVSTPFRETKSPDFVAKTASEIKFGPSWDPPFSVKRNSPIPELWAPGHTHGRRTGAFPKTIFEDPLQRLKSTKKGVWGNTFGHGRTESSCCEFSQKSTFLRITFLGRDVLSEVASTDVAAAGFRTGRMTLMFVAGFRNGSGIDLDARA